MFEFPIEIVALLTFLLTQGIKALLGLFDKDMSGMTAAIVAVAVGSLLFFMAGVIGIFPVEIQESIVAGLGLIGVILSGFGIHYTYKGIGVG